MRGGHSGLIEFDEKHMAVPENVVYVLKTLRRSLMSVYGVCSVVLFGSYAKGTFTPESDIDIAVFVRDGIDLLSVFRQSVKLSSGYPLDIQILVFYESSLDEPIGIVGEIAEYGFDISSL